MSTTNLKGATREAIWDELGRRGSFASALARFESTYGFPEDSQEMRAYGISKGYINQPSNKESMR